MKKGHYHFALFGLLLALGKNSFSQVDLETVAPETASDEVSAQDVLLQARQKLEDAELLAAQIVEAARFEAAKMAQTHRLQGALDLQGIKEEMIAIEVRGAHIKDLLQKIMPTHWRVMLDLEPAFVTGQRIDFIAEKKRDDVLFDLTQTLGLHYQYFANLKDSEGLSSPLLVVTQRQK